MTQAQVNRIAAQVVADERYLVEEAVDEVLREPARPEQQDRFDLWMAGRLAA